MSGERLGDYGCVVRGWVITRPCLNELQKDYCVKITLIAYFFMQIPDINNFFLMFKIKCGGKKDFKVLGK